MCPLVLLASSAVPITAASIALMVVTAYYYITGRHLGKDLASLFGSSTQSQVPDEIPPPTFGLRAWMLGGFLLAASALLVTWTLPKPQPSTFPGPGRYKADPTADLMAYEASVSEDRIIALRILDPLAEQDSRLQLLFNGVVSNDTVAYRCSYPKESPARLRARIIDSTLYIELITDSSATPIKRELLMNPMKENS